MKDVCVRMIHVMEKKQFKKENDHERLLRDGMHRIGLLPDGYFHSVDDSTRHGRVRGDGHNSF